MNAYNVYFCSKNTGPRTVEIEARSDFDAKSQVEARFPGAYNLQFTQKTKTDAACREDESRRRTQIQEAQDRATSREDEAHAKQRQMVQDNNERRARQETTNRADQERRDRENRTEQERRDRENSDRQGRETLEAVKSSSKGSGLFGNLVAGVAGFAAACATQPDALFDEDASYDEEVESGWSFDAERYGRESFLAPTREAALLVLEKCIRETYLHGYCVREQAIQCAKNEINQTWDRKDEEAREPHGPRLPMTPHDNNTVKTVVALFKQLPFTIHILWYPRTKILGCIFDDISFMNLQKGPSSWAKIIETVEGKNLDVRTVRHVGYSTDGPANAPFEIAEEWLQANGYWFFRGLTNTLLATRERAI